MRRFALFLAVVTCLGITATASVSPCERDGDTALRDVRWWDTQPAHPLVGQVLKSDRPIAIDPVRDPDGVVAAGYVLFTPRQPRPHPCEKMRRPKP